MEAPLPSFISVESNLEALTLLERPVTRLEGESGFFT
jgi:hypothetical protein